MKNLSIYLWLAATVICLSSASVFAKQAGLASKGHELVAIIFNGWYVAEVFALFLQACCWVMVLRKASLSFAYPFTSVVYALNLLSSWLIFKEEIRLNHVLGILLIAGGVAISARSVNR
jgi:drug/metabolite transporter (DMT)-like permease